MPNLFPARRSPPPIPELAAPAPAPVPIISVQVTCFGCFNEATLRVPAGTHTAPCPSCGGALVIEVAPKQDGRPAAGAAFRGVGNDVNERVRQMAEHEAATDMDNAHAALNALSIAARLMGS